jgi:hypothetical protein
MAPLLTLQLYFIAPLNESLKSCALKGKLYEKPSHFLVDMQRVRKNIN